MELLRLRCRPTLLFDQTQQSANPFFTSQNYMVWTEGRSHPSASDPGNLFKIPFFSRQDPGNTRGRTGDLTGKLPGISRCAKIEQDPAFPAGKSGIFKNPDRKTGKKLNSFRDSPVGSYRETREL